MLEARRIAGIDAKSYLPPTIQGRLTSASAVMDDIHRLLLCLSTSPDDEEALLRIEEGYRDPGRPRERAQAWERAIENELAPGQGTLKQRLLIRKMWELGTEEVVMQTCISLDGDVVTRIDPQLLAKPAELREVLLGVHRESTSVSIRFWSALVSTATNLLGGLGWRSSSSSAPAE